MRARLRRRRSAHNRANPRQKGRSGHRTPLSKTLGSPIPPKQKSVARRQRLAGSVRSLPVGNGEQLDAIAIWVFNLDADEPVIILPLGLGHSGAAEPLPPASDFVAVCELKAEVVRAGQ